MTTGIQSKGVDLDSIFDPYVTGTSPAANGIQVNGTDIHTRYAPLLYGTAAAATGILCEPGGSGSAVDLNTLYAAHGTAKYSTPDNGTPYSSIVNIPFGSNDSAEIQLYMQSGQYQVWVHNHALSSGGVTTKYNLTIPDGVTQFTATLEFVSGTQTLTTMTDTTKWTNIPSALTQVASVVSGPRGGASGTVDSNWSLALKFGNGGTAIFTGSNAWSLETDGSA